MDPMAIVVPIIALLSVVLGFSLARIKARGDHKMMMEQIEAEQGVRRIS